MSALLGHARAEGLLIDFVDYLGKAEADIDRTRAEPTALRRTLHDLRATSGMLGFDALSEFCMASLSDASERPLPDKVARLLELTGQSLQLARQYLAASHAAAAA